MLLLLLALPAALAGVVKIERISPPPLDLEVSVPAGTSPEISADGRFVAFVVQYRDIYVRDRQSGKSELVSVSAGGAPANAYSDSPEISADGRFVAFQSAGSNLVPGDTNDTWGVFLRDRQTGKTEFVSVGTEGAPANGPSSSPTISGDGRFVAFSSEGDNLVPGDTNGRLDVFVAERE